MKNYYEVDGDIVKVFMNKRGRKRAISDKFFIIDIVDLPLLLNIDGVFCVSGGNGKRGNRGPNISLLEQMVTGELKKTSIALVLNPQAVCCVYADNDGFNNRRNNIINVMPSEVKQKQYSLQSNNKSGYRGVCWDSRHRRWKVQVCVGGHITNGGHFDDVHEAGAHAKRMREELMTAACEDVSKVAVV